jgi:hypothetical protein
LLLLLLEEEEEEEEEETGQVPTLAMYLGTWAYIRTCINLGSHASVSFEISIMPDRQPRHRATPSINLLASSRDGSLDNLGWWIS